MAVERVSEGGCRCKTGRLLDNCDCEELNEQLVEWWTADDSRSLRDMAEYVNQERLRTVLNRDGQSPLDGEVANVYRLLTDDDVDSGTKTQLRRRFERQGIDIEQITDEFVSYQSIYRHLTNCLDVEYPETEPSAEDRLESGTDRIFALQNRTETVTRETLSQLVDRDVLALDDFDVIVTASVTCHHCHRQFTIDEVVETGGCVCRQP